MLRIRMAKSFADFQKIEELAYQILPVAYQDSMPKEHILFMVEKYHSTEVTQYQEESQYYLLEWNGEKVGYLGLENKFLVLFLSKLYILPAYQGKGIGKQVLDFVEKQTKEYPIELVVQKQNQQAVKFYEKHGYTIKKEISHTFENAHTLFGYLMHKEII